MPEYVGLSTGQVSLSLLDGNELRVHPEVYQRMQETIVLGDGSDDERSAAALICAGLNDAEIVGRSFQETKIVVDPALTSHMELEKPVTD